MSKFKVGDRVRIKRDISMGDKGVIESMCRYGGEEVTIANVHENPNVMPYYSVGENIFLWDESILEPIVPSLRDIKEKKIDCLIRTRTQRDADKLFIKLETNGTWSADKCWTVYKNNMAYHIEDGKIHAFSDINWYKTNHPYSELPIYEFEDIMQDDIMQDGGIIKDWTIVQPFSDDFIPKLKEYYKEYYAKPFNPKIPIKAKKINNKKENDNNMKFTFFTEQGERIDKTCNEKIPTITTYAISNLVTGDSATATCDKCDYDRRTGALVAAAKVISKKSEETHLMYDIAMKMWGSDFCNAILETFANRAYAGNFEKYYDKWVREEKKLNDDKCKCKVCGKKFDTPDDAREHEEWHVEHKKAKRENYLIRKEAKRRLAEKEKENKIEKAIIEIKEEEKEKNKKKEEEKNRNK